MFSLVCVIRIVIDQPGQDYSQDRSQDCFTGGVLDEFPADGREELRGSRMLLDMGYLNPPPRPDYGPG